MIKRMVVTLTLMMLGTTPAAAQMGGMRGQLPDSVPSRAMGQGLMMGGMMGQGMMGSGMMTMMGQGMGVMATGGPGPVTLLRMREVLELTEEQIERLEAVQERFRRNTASHVSTMTSSHQAAAQALEGDVPDLEAYQQRLQAQANISVQFHVAMAQAAMGAREVLTQEQRGRLQAEGPQMMDGMMGRYGWGGRMRNDRR
jgi:Spy/CpxP family protein refolding chaperone